MRLWIKLLTIILLLSYNSFANNLIQKDKITICTTQNKPFTFSNNNHIYGITIDIFKQVESNLGIPIEFVIKDNKSECRVLLKSKEVDFMTMLVVNNYNKKDQFTFAYLNDFFVLITSTNKPYIDNLTNIKHMNISINEEFESILPQLKSKYPTINFILVKNTKEGLQGLMYEDYYAHIDLHKTMAWLIQNKYLGELKVSGILKNYDVKQVLYYQGIENKLINALNNAIKGIDKKIKRDIENSWVSIVYTKGFDYRLLWEVLVVFLLTIIIILYFNYQLKKQVQKHIQKNKDQQDLLFQQAKLASMGEMLNNIAHQWRQPLNRINSSAAVIYTMGDKIIQKKVKDIENNTKYMSNTIEDFSNFFHPDKGKDYFNPLDAVEQACRLLSSRIKNIDIKINLHSPMKIYTYENEFIQVILTILNNAIDNFELKKVEKPTIKINIKKENMEFVLTISDNGGGIDKSIIDKIFDPYFTTKFSSEGKGIGLYMSKMICENSMDGILVANNHKDGVVFTIKLNCLKK
jgi:signal transduction histidine kinase